MATGRVGAWGEVVSCQERLGKCHREQSRAAHRRWESLGMPRLEGTAGAEQCSGGGGGVFGVFFPTSVCALRRVFTYA